MPVSEIFNPTATKCITFMPDSLHLVGTDEENSVNGYVRQWNIGHFGNEISSFGMKSTGHVNAIASSKDGQWIVTGGNSGNQGQVIVWDAVTRTIAKQISEHTGQVYAIDVSSDSTRIASASADYTVRIFSIISGVRLIPPLAVGNSGAPTAVKFSLDGSRVAAAAYTHVGVYDVHSGNKLLDIPVQYTSSLAWSFDGQQLLFSSLGQIICFGGSTSSHFKLAWFVNNTDDPNKLLNSYNSSVVTHGRFIACAKGLRLSFWDYILGKQIGTSIDHASVVNCISISPDGKYLACGHQQGITVHNLGRILPQHYFRIPRVPRIPLLQVDDPVLEPWTLGKLTDAESILSKEITNSQGSDPDYHALTLAARSIIRSRLKQSPATDDAEKSLQVKQSPIGQVAKSLALIGAGKKQVALDNFDLAFCDDPACDTVLLLVIKSILMFMCGKHKQAASRLLSLLTTVDEETKSHYIPVLGNMYLKQGDCERVVQTLVLSKKPSISRGSDPSMTITLIFDWTFDRLKDLACQRLCESLYPSGHVKEVGETLLKMVSGLTEDEREPAHGRILEELVTRSGQTTLLTWTGKSSKCNSCLPSSPTVYSRQPFVPPHLEPAELEKRMDELRALLPHMDTMVIYAQATRFQPVRFAHFRLHLPCIVFSVKGFRRKRAYVYYAETAELGDVEFKTVDSLPFEEPQRLVFADLRIHGLKLESDTQWNSSDMGNNVADANAELVHAPMIEEVPSGEPQLDTYTRALQFLVRLGQPFSALLLLRQSDGSYKRVAADNEIIVRGTGNNVPKDIRVEVLEIL